MESAPAANKPAFLYLVLGFILGAIVVGASWLTTRQAEPFRIHDVTVDFLYETAPGRAEGSSDSTADSIEFHPGYVVVKSPNGTGNVYAVDRLRRFAFRPSTAE